MDILGLGRSLILYITGTSNIILIILIIVDLCNAAKRLAYSTLTFSVMLVLSTFDLPRKVENHRKIEPGRENKFASVRQAFQALRVVCH